jgi:peroxiredoxin family protein
MSEPAQAFDTEEVSAQETEEGLSMVVFSGDLDKLLAAFIIANGAAAMDMPVHMFFTFWGLNVLRKDEAVSVKKNMIEGMFGRMMPRGASKMKLSKMNMMGMGTKMIKDIMKQKNVYSLPQLVALARESGVKMVACTMTLDLMGIKREELIDGVEFGGVASFLDSANHSKSTLFI